MIERLGLVMFFLLLASLAHASTAKFVWRYDYPAQEIIEGFRLYRDGEPLPVIISKYTRALEIPHPEDQQDHTYFLTAFAGDIESDPSDKVIIRAILPVYTPYIPYSQTERIPYQ